MKKRKRTKFDATGWNINGLLNIGEAFLLYAIYDVKLLIERGVIVDGCKVVDPWPIEPSGRRKRYSCYYQTPYQVLELIEFFKCGDAELFFEEFGVTADISAINKQLGLA